MTRRCARFAGGRVRTYQPLRLGMEASSTIEVIDQRERTGRSGWMMIVTTLRTITQRGATAIADEVDLVYREPTPLPTGAPRPPEPQAPGAEAQWSFSVDETVLFRFSALTRNAHRIHYDVDYCRTVEDYQGLVVHGPLQALLMAQWAARSPLLAGHPEPGPSTFSYRLVAPLILGQGMVVGWSDDQPAGVATSVRDTTGRTTATGLLHRD